MFETRFLSLVLTFSAWLVVKYCWISRSISAFNWFHFRLDDDVLLLDESGRSMSTDLIKQGNYPLRRSPKLMIPQAHSLINNVYIFKLFGHKFATGDPGV